MSLSGDDHEAFFGPLKGKTATFVLEGRRPNQAFAGMVTRFLAQSRSPCEILDLDAFYSSNSDWLFSSTDPDAARLTRIMVPEPGSEVESELSKLFESQQKVIIIDSLNSLHHLFSLEGGSSRSRKLTFALASLSYLARTNSSAVILSMYRREGLLRGGSARSISALSDVTARVYESEGELKIKIERGQAWPGGEFSNRIP